jgi:hypothetical protein
VVKELPPFQSKWKDILPAWQNRYYWNCLVALEEKRIQFEKSRNEIPLT